MGKGQKKIILIILLCLFTASLAYRLTHPFKQGKVEKLTYQGNGQGISMKDSSLKGEEAVFSGGYVRLDLFNNHLLYSKNVKKNIFFSGLSPSVSNALSGQENALHVNTPAEPIPVEVTRRLQVQQELNDFKSFGYLESDEGITLFLERGKQILVVRKGDRIDGKYLIKDITRNELTITAMTINEDIHIDISQLD